MEEVLELAVIIIVAVIGGIAKIAGGKKKKAEKRSSSAWDELGEKIGGGIEKMLEMMEQDDRTSQNAKKQIETQIPYAEPTVSVPMPTVVQPVAPMPAEVVGPAVPVAKAVPQPGTEVMSSAEGSCEHPLHEPVPVMAVSPVPTKIQLKPEKALEVVHISGAGLSPVSRRITAAQLRQAVVMSEILGKPVALRGGARR